MQSTDGLSTPAGRVSRGPAAASGVTSLPAQVVAEQSEVRTSVQPQLNSCVLHGSRIPDKTGGRFLVWGEEARRLRPSGGRHHPFGLGPEALLPTVRGAWIARGRAANPEFR